MCTQICVHRKVDHSDNSYQMNNIRNSIRIIVFIIIVIVTLFIVTHNFFPIEFKNKSHLSY